MPVDKVNIYLFIFILFSFSVAAPTLLSLAKWVVRLLTFLFSELNWTRVSESDMLGAVNTFIVS